MKNKFLSWFLSALTVLSSPAFSAKLAAEPPPLQGPQRPINPADSVPHPIDDKSRCETGPEQAWKLVLTVSKNCTSQVADKAGDYAVIVGHLIWSVWVPGMSAIVLGELTKRLGKDATVCVLTSLVEGGGGTPQDKALAKAAIQEIQELMDRQKFLSKGSEALNAFNDFTQKNILADKDRKKFVMFAGKKLYDRVKNVNPEDNPVLEGLPAESREEKLFTAFLDWMNTPEQRQRKAFADAEQNIKQCLFDEANTQIGAAQFQNLNMLMSARQSMAAKMKEIRCNREAYWILSGPQDGTFTVQQARELLLEARQKAQFELEQLKTADKQLTWYMQELADRAGNIQAKRDEMNEKLRKPFNEAADRAQAAMDSCNYALAGKIIGELKQWTTTNACEKGMKHEYMRELELGNELQARKDKQIANEKKIDEIYQKALALPKDENCGAILDEADFIGKLAKGLCVNMADVEAKIANLKRAADECSKATGEAAESDKRLNDIDALGKLYTDEVAALAEQTKKATAVRGECATLFAPDAAGTLLPPGDVEALSHLSEHCTQAQGHIAALKTAAGDALKTGQQASQLMATQEGPPESTGSMRSASGLIVTIKDNDLAKIDQAAKDVANDLKPLDADLKVVALYKNKEKELNDKIAACDDAATGLQEKVGALDGLRKRFEEMKVNALAALSPQTGEVAQADKERFADRLTRIGKAELGGDAQAQVAAAQALISSAEKDKQAFGAAVSSAFKDVRGQWETPACAQFTAENGLANAGKAAHQSVEDVRALLSGLATAFKERKQKLAQIIKIDQETIKKGETILEKEKDAAKRTKIEGHVTNAKQRKANMETENPVLSEGQQRAEQAEQRVQSAVTLLGAGGN